MNASEQDRRDISVIGNISTRYRQDMDVCAIFESVKKFYHNVWKEDRLCIINEFRDIRDALQEQERIHNIGNITYSGVGIVGGGLAIGGIIAAPFTFGVSIGLTIAGAVIGITSGVAGITHAFVKIGIIKSMCNKAKGRIKDHDQKTETLKDLIRDLEKKIKLMEASLDENENGYLENDTELKEILLKENESLIQEGIKTVPGVVGVGFRLETLVTNAIVSNTLRVTGNADEVAKILSLGPALERVVPSTLQDVAGGVAKLSSEALSALAAIGIVIDLVSLVLSVRDLYKISKGELSRQAKQFDDIVNTYEEELEAFRNCFES